MKKIGLYLLAACITGISSCGPDGEVNTETEEVVKGRPTVIYIDSEKKELLHYTNENQLSKIVCDYTGVYEKALNIHYSGNEITGCTYTRNPERGGISKIDFNKTGNRIHVSIILGENESEKNFIIDLNSEGLPVGYSYLIEGDESIESEISYIPNSNKIHQIKRYVHTESTYTTHTHTLEYDDNSGITSNINCPVWFRLFLYNLEVVYNMDTSESYKELINYVNNVVNESIHVTYINPLLPSKDAEKVEYQYTYDEDGYPVSETQESFTIIIDEEGKPVYVPKSPLTITIKY